MIKLLIYFKGRLIAEQLLDVAIRVPVVRQFAVNEMTNLLDTFTVSSQSNSMYEVLYAAAWIVGEFSKLVLNKFYLNTVLF